MAEYNVDEYTVEGEDTQYNFKISLVDNKINLQLTEISENGPGKNYEGEFTLDELRQINRVFHLTNTIYDAQDTMPKKNLKRQLKDKKLLYQKMRLLLILCFIWC